MPLVSMKPILAAARQAGYGVGAFNILDYNSARAVVRAAEKLSAPVIVQTSVKTVKFWGASAIVSWMRELAANSPVPVALHLDHCLALEVIESCIAAGWTSVMLDASSKPFEENVRLTKKVLEMAEPAGVGVEAELGEIGGVEDDLKVAEEDAHLVDPEKAMVFCQMPLAVFAPAIGTAHGMYKSAPKIAFDRLEDSIAEPLCRSHYTGAPGCRMKSFIAASSWVAPRSTSPPNSSTRSLTRLWNITWPRRNMSP